MFSMFTESEGLHVLYSTLLYSTLQCSRADWRTEQCLPVPRSGAEDLSDLWSRRDYRTSEWVGEWVREREHLLFVWEARRGSQQSTKTSTSTRRRKTKWTKPHYVQNCTVRCSLVLISNQLITTSAGDFGATAESTRAATRTEAEAGPVEE